MSDLFEDAVPVPIDFPKPDHRASEDESRFRFRPPRSKDSPRTSSPLKPRIPAPEYKEGMFVEPVENLYIGIGKSVSIFRPEIGMVIEAQAHTCAEAWDHAARESDAVRKTLKYLSKASVGGELFVAHLPIFMVALASNERFQHVLADLMVRKMNLDDEDMTVDA